MKKFDIKDLNSGFYRNIESIDGISDVLNGFASVKTHSDIFKAVKFLQHRTLKSNTVVMASFHGNYAGIHLFNILGFEDEFGNMYSSVKDMLKTYGATTLKEIKSAKMIVSSVDKSSYKQVYNLIDGYWSNIEGALTKFAQMSVSN